MIWKVAHQLAVARLKRHGQRFSLAFWKFTNFVNHFKALRWFLELTSSSHSLTLPVISLLAEVESPSGAQAPKVSVASNIAPHDPNIPFVMFASFLGFVNSPHTQIEGFGERG
jgi:hypothetical protein